MRHSTLCVVLLMLSMLYSPVSADEPTLGVYLHVSWDRHSRVLTRLLDALNELGYDFVMLEVGGNVRLEHVSGLEVSSKAWSVEELRAVITHANQLGMRVYPVVSLLSHPGAMPYHPRYVDKRFGLRLWEAGVYEFVGSVVKEVMRVFRVNGAGVPFFHARMDEAREVLRVNSEHLNKPAGEILAEHITRVREMVAKEGARLVIFHDMLLSPEVAHIGTALGGAPLNSALALDKIPRDVIINFWLYDFLRVHAPAVEHFRRKGFEVWLSPWMAPEVGMAQYAAEQKLTLLETTWCSTGNLARYYANLRALVTAGYYLRHPDAPRLDELNFNPRLRIIRILCKRRVKARGGSYVISLPVSHISLPGKLLERLPKGEQSFSGMRFTIDTTRILCFGQHDEQGAELDEQIQKARRPLKVVREDGEEHVINAVNAGRGDSAVILYTPAWGRTTHTNIFGSEVVVVDGLVQDRTGSGYGAGNYPIPPGGYVLSAHFGSKRNNRSFFIKIGVGQRLRIVDRDGKDLMPSPASEELNEKVKVVVKMPAMPNAASVVILHATLKAAPHGRLMGVVHLTGSHGETLEMPIRYRQHLSAFTMPEWFLTPKGEPEETTWLAWSDDRSGDAMVLWATEVKFDPRWTPRQIEFIPASAGIRAGWTVLAVSAMR